MNKSDQAYKTIGEVVKILDIKNKSGKKIQISVENSIQTLLVVFEILS